MKRSFRGLISLALAACVAFSALAVASISHVADTAIASCRAFKDRIVADFLALAATEPGKPEAVPLARAKSFQARIEKRQRPVVTNSWRMCPSI
jgi:hypothetical protein